MDGTSSPRAAQVRHNAAVIQHNRKFRFDNFVLNEGAVYPANEVDSIRLNAFLLSAVEHPLALSARITQHATEPKARRTTLPETEFDQAALPNENLCRELSAVFPGHR